MVPRLNELLPFGDLWLHGHLHCPNDHMVRGQREDGSAWACRIVANPRGYFGKGEQAVFVARCVLSVPDAHDLIHEHKPNTHSITTTAPLLITPSTATHKSAPQPS